MKIQKYILIGLFALFFSVLTSSCYATTGQYPWYGNSSGDAACASRGANCTSAYSSSGSSVLCSQSSIYSGSANCSEPAGIGAIWYSSGGSGAAACAEKGANCVSSYNINGGLINSCYTAITIGGTAKCSQPDGIGAIWYSGGGSGAAACAEKGANCVSSYNSTGGSINSCYTAITTGGTAKCSQPDGIGTIWGSYVSISGVIACARKGANCSSAYNFSGGSVSCNQVVSGGSAKCSEPDGITTTWYVYHNTKTGNEACVDKGEPACLSSYDGDTGAKITCSSAVDYGIANCGGREEYSALITKSYQWTETLSGKLVYFWHRWNLSGWGLGLGPTNISINFNVGVKNIDNNVLIADGSSVSYGDNLRFNFVAHYYDDICWAGTGYSGDSPNGEWRAEGYNPPITCQEKDYVNTVTNTCGGTYRTYVPLLVVPPIKSLTNKNGMSCGALSGNEITGYYVDCKVTATSTITLNPVFNFAATTGKFYYRYYDTRTWCGGVSCVPGCYGDNNPMANINQNNYVYTCGETDWPSSAYTLNVPAQTIPYTLKVKINGSCGTANGVATSSAPTTNLCATGATSTVTGIGPWNWSCTGFGVGATNATCSAPKSTIGSCGPAATTYASASTTFSGVLCNNSGTTTPAVVNFPATAGTSVSWTCSGAGGQSGTCTATRSASVVVGSCGPAAAIYASASTTFSGALCNNSGTTTPAIVTFPATAGTSVSWTCSGQNGGLQSDTCTATRLALTPVAGSCGPAIGTYPSASTTFSGPLCNNSGTTTPATVLFPETPGSSKTWTCSGQNGGLQSDTCTATRSVSTAIGSCGPAKRDYAYADNDFVGDFCGPGETVSPSNPDFPSVGGPTTWWCTPTTGGESVPCIAKKLPVSSCHYDVTGIDIEHLGEKRYFSTASVDSADKCLSELITCNDGVLLADGNNISEAEGYTGEACIINGVVVGPLSPVCEAYQNNTLSNGNTIVNKIMQWRVSNIPSDAIILSNRDVGTGYLNTNPFFVYFTKLYQTLGIKILNIEVVDNQTGAKGSCTASTNVILGDQIIIER